MNKLGMVLGVAAVSVIAGCKDPDWNRKPLTQNEVKTIETEPVSAGENLAVTPAPAPVIVEEKHCMCPPGTKHTEPCTCGAPDCACIVVAKEVKPLPPPEPEYTTYIVQRGDYLAKISKKYNVTIASIKRLNGMKDDTVRLGQKIKLPGKIDVGEQTVPAGAIAVKESGAKSAKKAYTPYTGATKEYVVKSGDTLGAIAYGNGINVRQLKELNGLSSDALKIGQKLKIPAEKVVAAKKDAVKETVFAATPADPVVAPVATPVSDPDTTVAMPVSDPDATVATPVSNPDATVVPVANDIAAPTYTVQAGEDLADVSIRWGVSASVIRELNNLGENDKLVAGQILKLPADAQQQ